MIPWVAFKLKLTAGHSISDLCPENENTKVLKNLQQWPKRSLLLVWYQV
jgi:hypothetical protein